MRWNHLPLSNQHYPTNTNRILTITRAGSICFNLCWCVSVIQQQHFKYIFISHLYFCFKTPNIINVYTLNVDNIRHLNVLLNRPEFDPRKAGDIFL